MAIFLKVTIQPNTTQKLEFLACYFQIMYSFSRLVIIRDCKNPFSYNAIAVKKYTAGTIIGLSGKLRISKKKPAGVGHKVDASIHVVARSSNLKGTFRDS